MKRISGSLLCGKTYPSNGGRLNNGRSGYVYVHCTRKVVAIWT
jgi:hypothetical protein